MLHDLKVCSLIPAQCTQKVSCFILVYVLSHLISLFYSINNHRKSNTQVPRKHHCFIFWRSAVWFLLHVLRRYSVLFKFIYIVISIVYFLVFTTIASPTFKCRGNIIASCYEGLQFDTLPFLLEDLMIILLIYLVLLIVLY